MCVSHSWRVKHADAHIEGGADAHIEGGAGALIGWGQGLLVATDLVTKHVFGIRGAWLAFSLPCS